MAKPTQHCLLACVGSLHSASSLLAYLLYSLSAQHLQAVQARACAVWHMPLYLCGAGTTQSRSMHAMSHVCFMHVSVQSTGAPSPECRDVADVVAQLQVGGMGWRPCAE